MPWSASRVAYDDVARIQDALQCPEPMAWVLVRRGLRDPDAAREFLAADGPLDPPEAIPGIAEAADRVAEAIRAGHDIVIHGDYDCDGICSTAILLRALQARGARVRPFLPSRFTDGYGVAIGTVERLADEGCDLLVTVDCGTTAVEAIARARELGIDTVVCDHHLAGGLRPPAIIANPALGNAADVLPAAAGVTFKLTQALAARLDRDGTLAPDPDEALDLVALATVADAVPLAGENRRLVARGIAAIRSDPRPGIAALCRAAGITPRTIDARGLGWSLAPAINAAGRMAHPEEALAVLLGDESAALDTAAAALWNLNLERREVEQRVTAEAIAIIEASPAEVTDAHALVIAGEGWHEGVVGIVASRLVERFSRPAIVVTIGEDGAAKGSGRSLPGVDLHALVSGAADPLDRWGGHAGAIGVQLPAERIAEFRSGVTTAALPYRAAIARARVRPVDAVVALRDLNLPTAEALEALQPFGTGNPEIRLVIPSCTIESAGRMGDGRKHLQMRVTSGTAHTRALGWGMGERAERLAVGERHDVSVQLTVDRWQEYVGPRVTIDGIDALEHGRTFNGMCAAPCDTSCGERTTLADLVALEPMPEAPATPASPAGIRDRRGHGAVIAHLTALAGADHGVVAIVADTARRRHLLTGVLAPDRLGVEAAVFGGGRCAREALLARIAAAARGPMLAMVEYRTLPLTALPEGVHVALVDPPANRTEWAWVQARAEGRWLHALWGDEEAAFAAACASGRWGVRGAATALWRALTADGGDDHPFGAALDRAAFGETAPLRDPESVGHALAALVELGRIELRSDGIRAIRSADAGRLEQTPRAMACAALLEDATDFVSRSATLNLGEPAVSSVHA